jgi:hypothetical protein
VNEWISGWAICVCMCVCVWDWWKKRVLTWNKSRVIRYNGEYDHNTYHICMKWWKELLIMML